jgi:4-hydroxy-tetrahydrodipicolinate reductase
MKLLVIGHGRMGALVEAHAASHGFDVAGVLGAQGNRGGLGITPERCRDIDVAVEFTRPESVVDNVRALAAAGLNAVIGTTGWRAHEAQLRGLVDDAGIGVVAAPNFSLGANLLAALTTQLASLLRGRTEYGAWAYEQHHAAKRDAPSGTALALVDAIRRGDSAREVNVAATRAGHIPGTHTIGVDGPAEQLTLTHLVRDRAAFAHGALIAARWVAGRKGWFTMEDVLDLGNR